MSSKRARLKKLLETYLKKAGSKADYKELVQGMLKNLSRYSSYQLDNLINVAEELDRKLELVKKRASS